MFRLCLLPFLLVALACSIPTLESSDCSAARQAVKEFYSFHFGNEMQFTPENLVLRERFLTPEFAASLAGRKIDGDPFTTGTNDFPKAFRVGACERAQPGGASVGVLLFWRDDVRSEQRKIYVETVKRDGKWLVNNISDR